MSPFFSPNVRGTYSSSTRTVKLNDDTTWLVALHEVSHALDHLWRGTAGYQKFGTPGREQHAYDIMKTFFWGYLNGSEQLQSASHLRNKGGDPW
jgi:hypothetical protein